MQFTVTTCDICKEEIKGYRPIDVKLMERSGNAFKLRHYEHICHKCENELVHFIEEGLKKPKES